MGYTTYFGGKFKLNKLADDNLKQMLHGLCTTRRMGRNVDPMYGAEGEFYFKDDNEGIIDYNTPPKTQPGLWCQWMLGDGEYIVWDGNEKFY